MRELSLKEIKTRELEILNRFDSICKTNGLNYSLAYGTLIGAVRHKGFIPWDDDIDVFMKREDYEKLLSLRYKDDRFEIRSHRYTKKYYYPFAKMTDNNTLLIESWRAEKNMGVYIDIFPLDSFDFDEQEKKILITKTSRLSNNAFIMGHKLSHHKAFSIRYFIKFIYLIVTYPFKRLIISRIDNYCKNYKNGNYYAQLIQPGEFNPFYDSKIFDDIELTDFEKSSFPIYSKYDEILSAQYGDYMTPPPIEQQITNHFFKAYEK